MSWLFQEGTAPSYLDLVQIMEALAIENHVDVLAVNAGGTGWAVGDTFTIDETGATVEHSQSARGVVTSVSAGVITGVAILDGGAYSVNPSTLTGNSITPAVASGSPSGGSVDITMAAGGWATSRKQTVDTTETELLLEGAGDGTDEIFVGVKTYRDTGLFNWELGGFTGYDSGFDWDEQPGFSGVGGGGTYTFTPIAGGAGSSVRYWFRITPYSILGIFNVGATYTNMYLGFLNRYAAKSIQPYPMAVGGCSSSRLRTYNESNNKEGGLINPSYDTNNGGSSSGPWAIRDQNGAWRSIRNGGGSGTGSYTNSTSGRLVLPMGVANNAANSEDQWFQTSVWNLNPFASPGASVPSGRLLPTDNTGGDIYARFPCTVVTEDPDPADWIVGEIDGVYWVNASGGLTSEDTLTDSEGHFVVFQNCNQSDAWNHFAVKRY